MVEKFSLDPTQFNSRITLSKICFIRLPQSEFVIDDKQGTDQFGNMPMEKQIQQINSKSLRAFMHIMDQLSDLNPNETLPIVTSK